MILLVKAQALFNINMNDLQVQAKHQQTDRNVKQHTCCQKTKMSANRQQRCQPTDNKYDSQQTTNMTANRQQI